MCTVGREMCAAGHPQVTNRSVSTDVRKSIFVFCMSKNTLKSHIIPLYFNEWHQTYMKQKKRKQLLKVRRGRERKLDVPFVGIAWGHPVYVRFYKTLAKFWEQSASA